MAEEGKTLLHVTMTPEAAVRFTEALNYAQARIEPNGPGPSNTRELAAYGHSEWLRWGIGRIQHAQIEGGE